MSIFNHGYHELGKIEDHSMDIPEAQQKDVVEQLAFGYLKDVVSDTDGITHIRIIHDGGENTEFWEVESAPF